MLSPGLSSWSTLNPRPFAFCHHTWGLMHTFLQTTCGWPGSKGTSLLLSCLSGNHSSLCLTDPWATQILSLPPTRGTCTRLIWALRRVSAFGFLWGLLFSCRYSHRQFAASQPPLILPSIFLKHQIFPDLKWLACLQKRLWGFSGLEDSKLFSVFYPPQYPAWCIAHSSALKTVLYSLKKQFFAGELKTIKWTNCCRPSGLAPHPGFQSRARNGSLGGPGGMKQAFKRVVGKQVR